MVRIYDIKTDDAEIEIKIEADNAFTVLVAMTDLINRITEFRNELIQEFIEERVRQIRK